ncbi:hypothetical protein ACSBR1_037181 [Camellia fascicularis]
MSPSKTPPLQIILSYQPCISGNPKIKCSEPLDSLEVNLNRCKEGAKYRRQGENPCFKSRISSYPHPHDPITGSTDTSSVTVEWAISELVKQPQFLRKATEELDRVIGRDRWVEEKDIPQLPYINLIAKEAMRLHLVATLLAPHYSIEDCNVAGYDIPKGTTVSFLGKEIDVKGQHFELLPFGSGKRMCPAYNLGLKLVKATLANLLHEFNWKLPDNMKPKDVDMEE